MDSANQTLNEMRNGLSIFGREQNFVEPTVWEVFDQRTQESVTELNFGNMKEILKPPAQDDDALTQQIEQAKEQIPVMEQRREALIGKLGQDVRALESLTSQYIGIRTACQNEYALIASQLPAFSQQNVAQISKLKDEISAQQSHDKRWAIFKDILVGLEVVVSIAAAVYTGGASLLSDLGGIGSDLGMVQAAAGAGQTLEALGGLTVDVANAINDGAQIGKSIADAISQGEAAWVPPGGDYNDPKIKQWTAQVNALRQRNKDLEDLRRLAQIVNLVDGRISECFLTSGGCSETLSEELPQLTLLQQDADALQLVMQSFISSFKGSPQGPQVKLDIDSYVGTIHSQILTIKALFLAHSEVQFTNTTYTLGNTRIELAREALANATAAQGVEKRRLFVSGQAAYRHWQTELWSNALLSWASEQRQYGFQNVESSTYEPGIYSEYSDTRLDKLQDAQKALQNKGTTANFDPGWQQYWDRMDFVLGDHSKATFAQLLHNRSATFVIPFPSDVSTSAYNVRFDQVRAYLVGATKQPDQTAIELKQLGRTSVYNSSFARFDYTFSCNATFEFAYSSTYEASSTQLLPDYGVHWSPYGPWQVTIKDGVPLDQFAGVNKVVFAFSLRSVQPMDRWQNDTYLTAFGRTGTVNGIPIKGGSQPISGRDDAEDRIRQADLTCCDQSSGQCYLDQSGVSQAKCTKSCKPPPSTAMPMERIIEEE
eukprot:g2066.t1